MKFLPLLTENRQFLLNILISLFGLLALVINLHKSIEEKRISYKVLNEGRVLDIHNVGLEEITVLVHGKEEEIYFGNYQIVNNGNIPIRKEDFKSNLVLEFLENIEILGYHISKNFQRPIFVELSRTENKIEIQPTRLNPGDFITVSVHSVGYLNPPIVNSRITGIDSSEIKEKGDVYYSVLSPSKIFYLVPFGLSFSIGYIRGFVMIIKKTSWFTRFVMIVAWFSLIYGYLAYSNLMFLWPEWEEFTVLLIFTVLGIVSSILQVVYEDHYRAIRSLNF